MSDLIPSTTREDHGTSSEWFSRVKKFCVVDAQCTLALQAIGVLAKYRDMGTPYSLAMSPIVCVL
jgi:hypothetical protein